MPHGGQAPEAHDENKADATTDPIDHATSRHQTKRVSKLKRSDDVSVLCFRPTDGVLKSGRKKTEYLTIHIVDRGCEEKHGADGPAHRGWGRTCNIRRKSGTSRSIRRLVRSCRVR